MQKSTMHLLIALVFVAVGLVGCDDDGATPTTTPGDDTAVTTTDTAGEQQGDATGPADDAGPADDTTEVPEPVDPCDPNPCGAQAAACDGDFAVTYGEGTCTNVDDAAVCDYTEEKVDCAADDMSCINGACISAGTPDDIAFSDVGSWVDSIVIGSGDADDACATDLDGDGVVDNGLGKLLNQLKPLVGDFDANGVIAENIANGSMTLIFDWAGLDDTFAGDASGVTMRGFFGEDADDDAANNLAGDGEYYVNPDSFIEGTDVSLIHFADVEIAGGAFTAGPAPFSLSLPLFEGITMDVDVANTYIGGAGVAHNGTGVEVSDGTIGGVIPMEQLYGALNLYVEANCDCLGIEQGVSLITYLDENTKAQCAPVNSICTDEDGFCGQIGQFCAVAVGVIKADIDSDDSGEEDGISVGLYYTAQSGTILGLMETTEGE